MFLPDPYDGSLYLYAFGAMPEGLKVTSKVVDFFF